jgi:hypothetical protein
MRFLQTVIFFCDYRHRLPLPDVWLAMAIKYVFSLIFFLRNNFCFNKKLSQGCYSIYCGLINSIFFNPLFFSCTPK